MAYLSWFDALEISIHALREEGDGGGLRHLLHRGISIHALREEGDVREANAAHSAPQFLSTPSARRATVPRPCGSYRSPISIHALREEGDVDFAFDRIGDLNISIHALREEGDRGQGGYQGDRERFLSTPSARRATWRI